MVLDSRTRAGSITTVMVFVLHYYGNGTLEKPLVLVTERASLPLARLHFQLLR